MMERPQFDVPLPDRMRGLPRDHRGFVIPFFVAWVKDGREVKQPEGEPDFRVVNSTSMRRCKRHRLCWLCGQMMGRHLVFAIGPMCSITRTTMEPPSHYECAAYAVKVCPFMTRPRMARNEKDIPPTYWTPGEAVARNPGVTALWVTKDYTTFKPGGGGELITVGDPDRVEWWTQGRRATRNEVQASIVSGLPALREMAQREGPAAVRELELKYIPRIEGLLPI